MTGASEDGPTPDERAAAALERIAEALEAIAENGSRSLSLATVLSGRTPSTPNKVKVYRVAEPTGDAERWYLATWRDEAPFSIAKTKLRLQAECGPGHYVVQLHGNGWGGDYTFTIDPA